MTSTDSVTSGPRTSTDFDFLVGTWDVEHHRLVAPLTGSTEWVVSGDSRAAGYTYLDGARQRRRDHASRAPAPRACRSGCTPPTATSGPSSGSAATTAASGRPCTAAGRASPASGAAGWWGRAPAGRPADPDDLRVERHHRDRRALAAGVLRRRRADLGEELGDALPPHRRRSCAGAAGPPPEGHLRLRLPHRYLAGPAPQAALAADRVHRLGRVRVPVRGPDPPQRAGEHRRGRVAAPLAVPRR